MNIKAKIERSEALLPGVQSWCDFGINLYCTAL